LLQEDCEATGAADGVSCIRAREPGWRPHSDPVGAAIRGDANYTAEPDLFHPAEKLAIEAFQNEGK
jgi:hypothetical protein